MGSTVTVSGYISVDNIIVAQTIIIIVPEVTPEPEVTAIPEVTPEPDADSDIIVVIQGPVVAITVNIVTIYTFNIELEPNNPILNIIAIGDIVRVEGVIGSTGFVVASVVSNVSTAIAETGATANLEGPIEAIDGNIVVVNGIPVQFAPDDPQLTALQIGDFLSVQGNFQNNGTTIVLVIVNVTLITTIIIDNDPYCWWHEGMGMGGMGMGGFRYRLRYRAL
jgi:hypothetical protein